MSTSGLNPEGPPVSTHPAKQPSHGVKLTGSYVTIVSSTGAHAHDLFEATKGESNSGLWDYLFSGPFENEDAMRQWLEGRSGLTDPVNYTILDNSDNKAVGTCSLWRIDLANRVVELGNILYTPALQRSRAATEAMLLLGEYVFEELGFRRYEWKCHSLNAPSRRAAARLGFQFEGVFRQHMIVKGGRNRDTAWFSMLDSEWPVVKHAMGQWLEESNFDADGKQKVRLEGFRK